MEPWQHYTNQMMYRVDIWNEDEIRDYYILMEVSPPPDSQSHSLQVVQLVLPPPAKRARLFTGRAPVSNGRGKAGLKF